MDVGAGYSAEAFSERQIHLPSGFWWAEGNRESVNSGTGCISRGPEDAQAAQKQGWRGVIG